MLALSDIAKQIGARTLFRDVNLLISPGERIGVVGANGSGKSTLLELLAGAVEPDQGELNRTGSASIGYLRQEVPKLSGALLLDAVLEDHPLAALGRDLEDVTLRLEAAQGTAALEKLAARHGDIEARYQAQGGYTLKPRARRILAGLGFGEADMGRPVNTFSGGWLMRLGLGKLLLAEPDLLLLDEPTNYLDLASVIWLEGYLAAYPGAMLIVSHDRALLNRLATRIIEIANQTVTSTTGNYDDFIRAKALREAQRQAAKATQDRKIAQTQRFIDRFRYKNTKARQVQSRIKELEKIDRIEDAKHERTLNLRLPEPARSGRIQLKLAQIWKRYGDGPPVYSGIDFQIERGDRIVLVGPNGAGKSTLMKIAAGVLGFDQGERQLGHQVELAYFAQHQVEALDFKATILDVLRDTAPDQTDEELRRLLGAFLFTGEDTFKRVGVLSGGEKARVALAKVFVRAPNLVLLDEPTSHLDIRARDCLEEALANYSGSLLIISHDRHFIEALATSVVEVDGGQLTHSLGRYSEYEARQRAAEAAPSPIPVKDGVRPNRSTTRQRGAEARRARREALGPLERRVKELEAEVEVLESEHKSLEEAMAATDFYERPDFDQVLKRHKELAQAIEQHTTDWEIKMMQLEEERARFER